jgi:membrane associated rhomboid family serine protease
MTASASSEGPDRDGDAAASAESDAPPTPQALPDAQAGAEPAPSHCYRHPMREALVRCTRCDRPICPDCMRPASVGFHCPDDVKLANRGVRVARTPVGAPAQAMGAPYVTWSIISLNVLVYLLTVHQSGNNLNDPHRSSLFSDWFLSPYLVAHNHQYLRLIESAFLHENVIHIASNMIALWIIGPHLERLLGWWRFTGLYLLAGFGGGVAVYVFGARDIGVVGASGAIYGLFAACLLFVRELGFDRRYLIITIVANFVLTISVPDISKLGHVGGFVVGGLTSFALAGVPWARRRLSVIVQVSGMAAILAVLLLLVVYRTAVLG